jgi:hypothetical protein
MGASSKQQQQQQQQDTQSGESIYAMSDAAQQKEIDRLAMKLRQMESKLMSEEKARAAAQVIMLFDDNFVVLGMLQSYNLPGTNRRHGRTAA